MSDSVRPQRRQPTRLPRPWDSPGKNTGVGCHFLLQCMKVKSESEVTQSCPTCSDPMDCSPPGSSVHGIFQARVLEWGAIAFSARHPNAYIRAWRCCTRHRDMQTASRRPTSGYCLDTPTKLCIAFQTQNSIHNKLGLPSYSILGQKMGWCSVLRARPTPVCQQTSLHWHWPETQPAQRGVPTDASDSKPAPALVPTNQPRGQIKCSDKACVCMYVCV